MLIWRGKSEMKRLKAEFNHLAIVEKAVLGLATKWTSDE